MDLTNCVTVVQSTALNSFAKKRNHADPNIEPNMNHIIPYKHLFEIYMFVKVFSH